MAAETKFQVMPPQGGICEKCLRETINYVSSHAPVRGHLAYFSFLAHSKMFQVMPP